MPSFGRAISQCPPLASVRFVHSRSLFLSFPFPSFPFDSPKKYRSNDEFRPGWQRTHIYMHTPATRINYSSNIDCRSSSLFIFESFASSRGRVRTENGKKSRERARERETEGKRERERADLANVVSSCRSSRLHAFTRRTNPTIVIQSDYCQRGVCMRVGPKYAPKKRVQ